MPFYDYYCSANDRTVEVKHGISERIKTWGELCLLAGIDTEGAPENSPVEKLISTPQITTPPTNSKLKELGFTKLVKKDKGVYENVTASRGEKKIVKADDPSSMPHIHKKIQD